MATAAPALPITACLPVSPWLVGSRAMPVVTAFS